MTSFLSHPNTRDVCLCVWVWGQHYKHEFRTFGSLSYTAIGRNIPGFSKCFLSGQVLLCQKCLLWKVPRGAGEITAWGCGRWHHETKDVSSEYLPFSEPSACFLFEGHLRGIPVLHSYQWWSRQDGLGWGSQNAFFFQWTSRGICYKLDFLSPSLHESEYLWMGPENLHFK